MLPRALTSGPQLAVGEVGKEQAREGRQQEYEVEHRKLVPAAAHILVAVPGAGWDGHAVWGHSRVRGEAGSGPA